MTLSSIVSAFLLILVLGSTGESAQISCSSASLQHHSDDHVENFQIASFLPTEVRLAETRATGTQKSDGRTNGTQAAETRDPVLVGVRIAPPFVLAGPDGTYSGLTISLWEHIAEELGIEFAYEERDIAGLIDGVVQEKTLFAAASALTITAEREEILDFTHPFYVTGLGIAVPYKPTGIWQAMLAIFSPEFLWVVGLLILLLLFWGLLVWYFERVKNPDDFGGSPAEGIGSGFWWAAVTMTTVGYGDKAPKTLFGRAIGFVWMFAGIILISFFTASIASSLTVTQLDSRVSGPQDLPFVRVGVLEHSATIDYLEENRIRYRTYPDIEAGLQAVADDQIDAFVHDAPIIRYYSVQDFQNEVRVLPRTFNDQYYGIALPLGSPLRNDINRVMLEFIAGDEWEQLNHRYLGNL